MTHLPIIINNYNFILPHKVCFTDFNTTIYSGNKIAIIGRNGSGKSSLLSIIMNNALNDMTFGYVPQIIEDYQHYSGGQRFNKALTDALAKNPEVLLLDEPTNHLDLYNRKSLIRMLNSYQGTLIIVTHDLELLRNLVDVIWSIDDSKIDIFKGNYDDYIREKSTQRARITHELSLLDKKKKNCHVQLMKEQKRAKSSKARGEKHIKQRKWPTIVSDAKARQAVETSGRKKSQISSNKQEILDKLSELKLNEVITAKFSLTTAEIANKTIISINEASVGYSNTTILANINISITGSERIALIGNNGSGKSTIVKAILGNETIVMHGSWQMPNIKDIGYLDQHYHNLKPELTVFDTIKELAPNLPHSEIRRHLNDFLFRKNEEVTSTTLNLSGGEKCRLSLAQIAIKTPKLLILDEVTNNLDLQTREHVIEVLNAYPGAIIVISHDEDFLERINIDKVYEMKDFKSP